MSESGYYDSMYLFVKAPNEVQKEKVLNDVLADPVYFASDTLLKFVKGEIKEKVANGKTIKTSVTTPTVFGDYSMYEIDKNDVKELGQKLLDSSAKNKNFDSRFLEHEDAITFVQSITPIPDVKNKDVKL